MISARALVKKFRGAEVLRGISLGVRAGEVAAIIGPSGSGKSSFLRCLNGLERFEAGEIEVASCRLTPGTHPRRDAALLQKVRRRVGFVFQQFNLFPHLTALGNVIEAPIHVLGLSRDQAIARAREILDRVGLSEKADSLPRHLSGGEQQRVAIARALAMEPEVLLFDEPTSALDPVMTAEVLSVIGDLAEAGQTMIVVTHAMSFAASVATTVHVFAEGLVVESGPPDEVFAEPRHPTTKSLLAKFRA